MGSKADNLTVTNAYNGVVVPERIRMYDILEQRHKDFIRNERDRAIKKFLMDTLGPE